MQLLKALRGSLAVSRVVLGLVGWFSGSAVLVLTALVLANAAGLATRPGRPDRQEHRQAGGAADPLQRLLHRAQPARVVAPEESVTVLFAGLLGLVVYLLVSGRPARRVCPRWCTWR